MRARRLRDPGEELGLGLPLPRASFHDLVAAFASFYDCGEVSPPRLTRLIDKRLAGAPFELATLLLLLAWRFRSLARQGLQHKFADQPWTNPTASELKSLSIESDAACAESPPSPRELLS